MNRISGKIEFLHALRKMEFPQTGHVFEVNPAPQVYTYVSPQDEMWVFDVARARRIAREVYGPTSEGLTSFYVADFGTPEAIRARYRDLDEETIRGADTIDPIIAIAWEEEGVRGAMLIDGCHRLVRAADTGQKFIPGWMIEEAHVPELILAVADRELTAWLRDSDGPGHNTMFRALVEEVKGGDAG